MHDEAVDRFYLHMALTVSKRSIDPSTRVGSILVRDDKVISMGFNGFPAGIKAKPEALNDREMKLKLTVHGEMRAVLNAAFLGRATAGATLYTACHSGDLIWGGPPCVRCAVECIEAGIREVVSYPMKTVPSRWAEDLALAQSLLNEAGVIFRSLPFERAS